MDVDKRDLRDMRHSALMCHSCRYWTKRVWRLGKDNGTSRNGSTANNQQTKQRCYINSMNFERKVPQKHTQLYNCECPIRQELGVICNFRHPCCDSGCHAKQTS